MFLFGICHFREEKYNGLKQGASKQQFDDQQYVQENDKITSSTDDAFEQVRVSVSTTIPCLYGFFRSIIIKEE
jgi:hypothetical protein